MLHSRKEERRPRFERAAVRAILLTPRDLEILRAVRRHRLLRSTHLTALVVGSTQVVLRRLQLLFHHGYLDRPPAQLDWYGRASEPLVYALGQGGAHALATAEGGRGGGRWTTKNRRLSRPFLRHTLAVADIMVRFELACRGRDGVSLIRPEEVLARAPEATRRQRLPLRWQVDVRDAGTNHRLGLEPDAVFGLRFDSATGNRREAFFFLEADRGTMPVARKGLQQTSFRRKLIAYLETWRQELHRRHLGLSNFRVLTVTAGRDRMTHLLATCRSVARGQSLFLFTPNRLGMTSDDIMARDWIDGRGKLIRLLAKPTAQTS